MELADAVVNVQYDSSWGVWASVPFTPTSEARYGQRQFENGGLLDDKAFFADGEQIGNWFAAWFEDIPHEEKEEWMAIEGAEEMIREFEAERKVYN